MAPPAATSSRPRTRSGSQYPMGWPSRHPVSHHGTSPPKTPGARAKNTALPVAATLLRTRPSCPSPGFVPRFAAYRQPAGPKLIDHGQYRGGMMRYRRVLAVLGTLAALATAVVVAENAGTAAGPVTALETTDPTQCVECAECAAEPTPEPTPELTPEVAIRLLTTPEPTDSPSDSPTDPPSDPPRWDPFQYTFRIDIDANFKPTFNKDKSGADPANRSDALDGITAGEDKRHNCYTITFDGPLDL